MEQFFSWRTGVLKSSLQPTTRHVLLTLACHMNDAGESCYPSIARLCNETGLSKQTVITHLKIAEESGWIVTEKHGLKGQRWARNEYSMSWPKVVKEVDRLEQEGGQPNHQKVVKEVDLSTSVNSSGLDTNVSKPNTAREGDQDSILQDPVALNPDGTWSVDDAVFDRWIDAFKALRSRTATEDWIEAELVKASLWLQSNPRKRKKNLLRFVTAWLNRAANPPPAKLRAQTTRLACTRRTYGDAQ